MRLESTPGPEMNRLVASRNFWLLLVISALLLFVSPGLAGTVALLGLVGLTLEAKARTCVLEIDGDTLEFRNAFIVATMSRAMCSQARLRGNRLLGSELLIKGDCSVVMKNGRTYSRQSILIPDAFEMPLSDVQKVIEDWLNEGQSAPHDG